MVSTTLNASVPRPVGREPPRPPPPAVAREEEQWLFTEEELLQTPSIVDGMSPEEERMARGKGVNFILQVGMMLKLPQTTLSTAAVFFNRFLMRYSLKQTRKDFKPLHHYVRPYWNHVMDPEQTMLTEPEQIAATALFLATKVEENCRKMKELVIACVRVAMKDPNKVVDEQTKDYWRWRDTILFSEDILLESLCFDLSVEPPYKTMYEMLSYYGLEHNKRLRNATWAFLTDSNLTQLCLLFSSRTIAAASLFAGARMAEIELPSDENGRPWWEVQYVKLRDIRRACNLMADIYEQSPPKDGEASIYKGLRSPDSFDMSFNTPQCTENGQPEASQTDGPARENGLPSVSVSSQVDVTNGTASGNENGHGTLSSSGHENGAANAPSGGNENTTADVPMVDPAAPDDDGSEEGELEG